MPNARLRLAVKRAKQSEASSAHRKTFVRRTRLLVFFDEYFDYKKAVGVFKDVPQGIGGYDPGRLVRETERLIVHIVSEDKDVFRKLLTTDQAFIEPRPPQSNQTPTHRIYNLPADFKVRKGPVTLSSEERAGILTQPAWLIAHSTNFDNDPVRRAKWILEHLLGGTVPDVPVTVNAVVSRDQTRHSATDSKPSAPTPIAGSVTNR